MFDDVIVGAGTTGTVLAARLSEDPARRVLLLEAGPDRSDGGGPAWLRTGYMEPDAEHDWGLTATLTGDRTGFVARSRVVGGASQTNDRGAVRPPAADFDAWSRHGAPSWAWREVLPSFNRLEADAQFGGRAHHGAAGPIPVTRWDRSALEPAMAGLLDAAEGAGHGWCEDLNAPDAVGIGTYPQNRRGRLRVSTADAYLTPEVRARENLVVRARATVQRLAFEHEGARVRGVVVDGEVVEGRSVTVCCGAPLSAALLLRSGIGPADGLAAAGVACVVDLAGVGSGLIDQPGAAIPVVPREARLAPEWPRTQVLGRLAGFPGHPEDAASYLCLFSGMRIPELEAMTGVPVLNLVMVGDMACRSRGTATLDPADPAGLPRVDLGFYSDPDDLGRMIAAYREAWALATSPAFSRTAERFALVDDELVADDAALGGLLRATTISRWNLLGGCAMGADDDPLAVVDDRCAVRGVPGLRVADASIVPVPLRAPAALTCVMIGEHLARLSGADR